MHNHKQFYLTVMVALLSVSEVWACSLNNPRVKSIQAFWRRAFIVAADRSPPKAGTPGRRCLQWAKTKTRKRSRNQWQAVGTLY